MVTVIDWILANHNNPDREADSVVGGLVIVNVVWFGGST